MSLKNTVVCDNTTCNVEKRETNHWFRILSEPPFIVILPDNETAFPFLGQTGERAVYDACGESCVAVIVSRILDARKGR